MIPHTIALVGVLAASGYVTKFLLDGLAAKERGL